MTQILYKSIPLNALRILSTRNSCVVYLSRILCLLFFLKKIPVLRWSVRAENADFTRHICIQWTAVHVKFDVLYFWCMQLIFMAYHAFNKSANVASMCCVHYENVFNTHTALVWLHFNSSPWTTHNQFKYSTWFICGTWNFLWSCRSKQCKKSNGNVHNKHVKDDLCRILYIKSIFSSMLNALVVDLYRILLVLSIYCSIEHQE